MSVQTKQEINMMCMYPNLQCQQKMKLSCGRGCGTMWEHTEVNIQVLPLMSTGAMEIYFEQFEVMEFTKPV